MSWWLFKNKVKELLGIKDRLYKCEYCGVYTYPRVVIKGLPPYEGKDLYIDSLLPEFARKFRHE